MVSDEKLAYISSTKPASNRIKSIEIDLSFFCEGIVICLAFYNEKNTSRSEDHIKFTFCLTSTYFISPLFIVSKICFVYLFPYIYLQPITIEEFTHIAISNGTLQSARCSTVNC